MSATPLRVLSVIPPMTQLNTPYPSTAYLTGFLRSRGVTATQEDLALALVLRLLSPEGPVSYTHLDVYKRQQLGLADLFEPLGIERYQPDTLRAVMLSLRLAAGCAGKYAMDAAYARVRDADAVSYTHLDVYKRQTCMAASTSRCCKAWKAASGRPNCWRVFR